jgi:hypothetical protein
VADASASNDGDGVSLPTGETTPDRKALSRGVSVAPRFGGNTFPRPQAAHLSDMPEALKVRLSDMPEAAIRARYVVLQTFNALVEPSLPFIDLAQYALVDSLGHRICRWKGRLFPDTKLGLIKKGIELTQSSTDSRAPEVVLNVPAPGDEASEDTVFEQLFSELHSTHDLRIWGKDAQLWKVRMRGEGARALFTDTTDMGGWFRTSVSKLCSDLQSPPRKTKALSDGSGWSMSTPLLVPTPNFRRGLGQGDDSTERYLPNPSCVTVDELARYEFLGCLMGAACRFSGFCELDLPPLIWKSMLGEQIQFRELQGCDAETASHLEAVAATNNQALWSTQAEVDPVRWSFRRVDGKVSAIRGVGTELVSFDERADYVAALESAWLAQFQPQIEAMCKGFAGAFPVLSARLLTWRELERRVCGVPDVSADALQRIAKYEGSYSKESDCEYTLHVCVCACARVCV